MSTLNFDRCGSVPVYTQSKEKKLIRAKVERPVTLAKAWSIPQHRIDFLNRVAPSTAGKEMQPT